MGKVTLALAVLDGSFSVCRLAQETDIPLWVPSTGFVFITRTADELPIVCPSDAVLDSVRAHGIYDC